MGRLGHIHVGIRGVLEFVLAILDIGIHEVAVAVLVDTDFPNLDDALLFQDAPAGAFAHKVGHAFGRDQLAGRDHDVAVPEPVLFPADAFEAQHVFVDPVHQVIHPREGYHATVD